MPHTNILCTVHLKVVFINTIFIHRVFSSCWLHLIIYTLNSKHHTNCIHHLYVKSILHLPLYNHYLYLFFTYHLYNIFDVHIQLLKHILYLLTLYIKCENFILTFWCFIKAKHHML